MPTTPFMSLDLPTVSVTPGPQWATDLNAAITLVDSHDHSTGKGVKITPLGLDINADLDISQNNLDDARSYRMFDNVATLGGASDLTSIYVKGGDLFYNNDSGTPVQITLGAAINASVIGGIGGDYSSSPAIVKYTLASNLYTFDEDTNKRAKMDFGEFTVRETSVTSSNGATIKVPASLAASYTMTLLTALPGSELPLFIDSSGNWSTAGEVDTASIKDDAITTAKILNLNVTTGKLADNAVDGDKIADTVRRIQRQVETASTTFVVPANITKMRIIGAGGGGGGGGGDTNSGGAGGNGVVPYPTYVDVTPGNTLTITIGAGGTGGGVAGTGAVGGNTTVFDGATLIAQWRGGVGGVGASNPSGGVGNGDTVRSTNITSGGGNGGNSGGANGGAGNISPYANGGNGGALSGLFSGGGGGGAGHGAGADGGNANSAGAGGNGFGAGTSAGGGGGGGGSAGAGSGSDGGDGIVIFEWVD